METRDSIVHVGNGTWENGSCQACGTYHYVRVIHTRHLITRFCDRCLADIQQQVTRLKRYRKSRRRK